MAERSLQLEIGKTASLDPNQPLLLKHLKTVVRSLTEAIALDFEARLEVLRRRVTELESRPLKYLGTFEPHKEYPAGSVVTDKGSLWCALQQTTARPSFDATSPWQLCCKSGRPGRDGKDTTR